MHDFATKGETLQQLLRQPELSERHDRLAQSATSQVIAKVNEEILPTKLMRPFPSNNFLIMTQSGSKGSAVNLSWVATLIGQVSLESRRPLPMFERGDMSARAHGFVMSRFVTGLRPDEYFNASAGGREGLVDTAIKTAYGGYMQRSMTKHLEAVHVAYDGTVRSSDGQIIEFIYGEDGIDPAKSPYLRDFAFMRSNYDGYKQRSKPIADVGPPDDAITYLDDNPLAERGETAQSKFSPITTIGAVSERFERAFLDYAEKNPETDSVRNDVPPLEKLRIVSMFNYFMSQIHCGEPVGICAAQAVGEPLTQMTMNTFHLAGYAGTNVTMGVPRLQELLIVASRKPRTPTMTIPFRTIEEAEAFARRFSRVPLRSLVEEFEYEELFEGGERRVSVDLRLNPERVDEMGGTIEWDSVQLRFSRALRRKITTVLAHEGGAKLTEIEEAQPRARNQPRDEDLGIIKRRERKEEAHGFGEKPEGDSQSEDDELDLDAPGSELPEEDVPENLEMERFGNVIHVAFSVGNVKVRLLLDSLIELALDGVMVRETRGISRAVASPADKAHGSPYVTTEGANFWEVLTREDIDFRHFGSNHVSEVAKVFGIEAARSVIIREVFNVFDIYGLQIDWRHLQLITDYTTQSGEWIGLNRHSMTICPSPLQQMSFETSGTFLGEAAAFGAGDALRSPSAAISVGNAPRFGTGVCDILAVPS